MSRNYNPELGSFISLDAEQDLDLDNPLNRNGYSYGLNNPVTFVDDDGNNPFIIFLIVFVVKVVAKKTVKAVVKKTAKKAIFKPLKKGTSGTAKKVSYSGKKATNKLPSKEQKPYSYADRIDSEGKLVQRRFYDKNGNAKKRY